MVHPRSARQRDTCVRTRRGQLAGPRGGPRGPGRGTPRPYHQPDARRGERAALPVDRVGHRRPGSGRRGRRGRGLRGRRGRGDRGRGCRRPGRRSRRGGLARSRGARSRGHPGRQGHCQLVGAGGAGADLDRIGLLERRAQPDVGQGWVRGAHWGWDRERRGPLGWQGAGEEPGRKGRDSHTRPDARPFAEGAVPSLEPGWPVSAAGDGGRRSGGYAVQQLIRNAHIFPRKFELGAPPGVPASPRLFGGEERIISQISRSQLDEKLGLPRAPDVRRAGRLL